MLRRLTQTGLRVTSVSALVLTAALVAVAAAFSYGGGGATGKFAATFDTRAVGDASIDFCRGLGVEGQKIEARYQGAMTIDGEEFAFNFTTLEILFDRRSGVGTAEGTWQLVDPSDRSIVGSGELVAVVNALEPPDPDAQPPEPDLELQGLLIGYSQAPEPDMPTQRLLGNFTASLGEGATFPHLKGTVGDPSVGDPSVGDPTAPNAAVLLPSDVC